MRTTTEMKLVPIAKLVPYINNARTHSAEQIMKLRSSFREFGFINPVIIDRASQEPGHQRLEQRTGLLRRSSTPAHGLLP